MSEHGDAGFALRANVRLTSEQLRLVPRGLRLEDGHAVETWRLIGREDDDAGAVDVFELELLRFRDSLQSFQHLFGGWPDLRILQQFGNPNLTGGDGGLRNLN